MVSRFRAGGAAPPWRRAGWPVVRMGWRRWEWVEGYLFLAPWLVGFFVWTLGPMVFSAGLVFTHWELLTPIRWAGTENLARLAQDRLFLTSLYNTAYFTFLSVPLQLALSLAAAMALNLPFRGVRLYRAAFYVPSITPQVAS